MDRWMDGWLGGYTDRWMDGWLMRKSNLLIRLFFVDACIVDHKFFTVSDVCDSGF